MTVWKIKSKLDASTLESKKYHPVVLHLLAQRGIASEKDTDDFFNFSYDNLQNPLEITDMEKAAGRIALAKERKERIAIFGDYDADGVTATALLFEALCDLGYENVTYYIPDRQSEGYGMSEKAVDYLVKEKVTLIITVDCGITNVVEIEKAKIRGVDVIITDHHHVPKVLPKAFAIINPHRENSGFRLPTGGSDFAGVGVAFKLVQALYQVMSPENLEQLKWALDLVSIGTVADCVSLLGENRILVKYGLVVLSKTRRVGLREMFQVGRIDISEDNVPDARKVAYQIAPRINASGRMDHASVSYNLIIEKDRVRAREMALEVEKKNQERQKVTAEIFREVSVLAENSFKDRKMIFAENPHWPVGVLGLVAGKITEEFRKPTIILQDQENVLVGSLRSIPEVNIIKIIEQCSDLLLKFGGHSQAAGVSVTRENVEKFYEKLTDLVEKELAGKEILSEIEVDSEISASDINWELIGDLKKMEPFGMGNPEPVFVMCGASVVDAKIVGNGSKHLKMSLRQDQSPKIFEAIGFSLAERFSEIKAGDVIDIVFNLQEDDWNGNKKMQLKLIDMKKTDE